MTIGPGKYDDVCTLARQAAGCDETGGAVVLIVIGGRHGNGFSMQSDLDTLNMLPDLLEQMAKQIRSDVYG
jgi:hypothetical protein